MVEQELISVAKETNNCYNLDCENQIKYYFIIINTTKERNWNPSPYISLPLIKFNFLKNSAPNIKELEERSEHQTLVQISIPKMNNELYINTSSFFNQLRHFFFFNQSRKSHPIPLLLCQLIRFLLLKNSGMLGARDPSQGGTGPSMVPAREPSQGDTGPCLVPASQTKMARVY